MAKTYRPKSSDEIRRNMSAIRSTGNRAEESLRRLLHSMGYRYRKYAPGIVGKPDIIFPREKVAVFVDGDYWHGRLLRERGLDALREYYTRKQHEYWLAKMQRNVARDDHVNEALRAAGWIVLRFWESDVRKRMPVIVRSVARCVGRRRQRLR